MQIQSNGRAATSLWAWQLPLLPLLLLVATSSGLETAPETNRSCEAQYKEGYDILRCRRTRDSTSAECLPPDLICDGMVDCVSSEDEIGCGYVNSMQMVSFRSYIFYDQALNCYCTARCLFNRFIYCKTAYCAGPSDRRCADQHAAFRIYVPDVEYGTKIRSGDTVGILYDTQRHMWLGCSAGTGKCKTYGCPGNDVQRINKDCDGERFQIFLAEDSELAQRCRNCDRPPIYDGALVMLKHSSGFLSATGPSEKVRVSECRLSDKQIQARAVTNCPNHVWRISLTI